MSDYPRWKYALVVLVLALGVIYAVPNFFQRETAVQVSANRDAEINASFQSRVRGMLDSGDIRYREVELADGGEHLLVRLGDTSGDAQAASSEGPKVADYLKGELGDEYVVALNLASTTPHWLRAIHADAMRLGLDLRGGVHFLMQVDQAAVRENRSKTYVNDIRSTLRDADIRYRAVSKRDEGIGADVVLRSADDRDQAIKLIGNDFSKLRITTGASKEGHYVLHGQMSDDAVRKLAQKTLQQNVGTLRKRINELGVSEPVIQQQGENRIVVELAGVKDTTQAKKMLGATATLEYRGGYGTPQQAREAETTGKIPPQAELYHTKGGRPVLLKKKIIATGDQLINASSGMDQRSGTPKVNVELNSAAAKRMFNFTSAHVGDPMAVVYKETVPQTKMVDGKKVYTSKTNERVISYANINGVFSNKFQTTGLDSMDAASDLALLLRSGSLAAPVRIVSERVIGASLGKDNIKRGITAVLLGVGIVLVMVALYYKLFGLVADVALFFNLMLLLAAMSLIGVTLTMAGIAGMVLTLGIAIDANVLICERVREELRNGCTPLAAIRLGYEKAWTTILDSHLTTMLAALALMTVATGSIRGFGVTLFIGITCSLFTSVTVTHAITALIHGGRKLKKLSV